jgi:hypothetical protein
MNDHENNRIIAEFMGFYGNPKTKEPITSIEKDSKYHLSWDWLMPVVDKIEDFQDGEDGDLMRGHLYNFRIEQYFVYILDGESMDVIIEMNGDSKLDATYNAVVEFIKSYNKGE